MPRARFRTIPRCADPLIRGLLLAALVAAPALGEPAAYDESFQACLAQAPEERQTCCTNTANECAGACQRDTEALGSSSAMTPEDLDEYLIACQSECAMSGSECESAPDTGSE